MNVDLPSSKCLVLVKIDYWCILFLRINTLYIHYLVVVLLLYCYSCLLFYIIPSVPKKTYI